jgi:hypothetical protein
MLKTRKFRVENKKLDRFQTKKTKIMLRVNNFKILDPQSMSLYLVKMIQKYRKKENIIQWNSNLNLKLALLFLKIIMMPNHSLMDEVMQVIWMATNLIKSWAATSRKCPATVELTAKCREIQLWELKIIIQTIRMSFKTYKITTSRSWDKRIMIILGYANSLWWSLEFKIYQSIPTCNSLMNRLTTSKSNRSLQEPIYQSNLIIVSQKR